MKVSMNWLGRYVDLSGVSAELLSEKLTWMGLEVEGCDPVSAMEKVVVGRVLSIGRHANADTLFICSVDVGGGEVLQIVTGAGNVMAGDLVPVALDGAVLPGGKTIRAGELRGEKSQGMLCSGPEMEIPDGLYPHVGEEGILIFREEHPVGQDARIPLGVMDTVLEISVTANRPDCQCILGIAREAAVALKKPLTMPNAKIDEDRCVQATREIDVAIHDADLCARFIGRIVEDIRIAPAPMWMRQSLHAVGVRPINNIVDITNFVMLEMGHPMHAYDLRTIRGGRILARRAAEGERLTTLAGKEHALDAPMLVIADGEGATGLAGIMGGLDSEIRDDTSGVLFEAAQFQAACIRVTARKLGVRTESSARFEKGVSQMTLPMASERACALVQELGAGKVASAARDVWPNPAAPARITASAERIRRYLSVAISAEEMAAHLRSLGFDVQAEGDALTAEVPAWRLDVEGWADLAEEILRVHGYDAVPSTLPRGVTVRGELSAWFSYKQKLQQIMCGMGFMEISTYSFVGASAFDALGLSEEDPQRRAARLLNPMGEEYAYMRTTLAPSMLAVLERNASRGQAGMRLFEIGAHFLPKALPLTELPEERKSMVIGMSGADFFAMKAMLTGLLRLIDAELVWTPGGPDYYHPGRKAEILRRGRHLAYAGELHPQVAQRFGLRERTALAEIDLSEDILPATIQAKPLPKYPAVTRDLALVVCEETPIGAVTGVIRESAGDMLESLEFFDIYRGAQLGNGKKSIAFSLVLRDAARTLDDARVQAAMERVLEACARELGAEIRS